MFGCFAYFLLVVAISHDHGMVSGFVGPGVTHPNGSVNHAVLFGGRSNCCIQALGWLNTGARFFARQQNRNRDPGFESRFAFAAFQPVDQVFKRPLPRLPRIFVRRQPVAGNQVGVFRQAPRHIAMQVHGSGDEGFVANHFADTLNKVSFGIIQTHHAHGAMNVEKHPIVGLILFQQFEGFPHQRFIGFAGNDASGNGAADLGWRPLCTLKKRRIAEERVV